VKRAIRATFVTLVFYLLAPAVFAEEPAEEPAEGADEPYTVEWLGSVELQGRGFESPSDNDNRTGYFDQYEFWDNKDDGFSFDLGLSELQLDVLGTDDTPLLQFRYDSPNFSDFKNQRSELLIRPRGIRIDFDYHRIRTDELRKFPVPSGIPSPDSVCPGPPPPGFACDIGSRFTDDSKANDRFHYQRTGVAGEMRIHLPEYAPDSGLAKTLSEIALRGRVETRDGDQQLNYMFGGSDRIGPGSNNDSVRWRGLNLDRKQTVGEIGSGLVLTPGGLFTLAFDFDYEGFRERADNVLQSDIAALDPTGLIRTDGTPGTLDDRSLRSLYFVPDTDRYTGSARLTAPLGEQTIVSGGFQFSHLEQVKSSTPRQDIAGLDRNEVDYYSAHLGADVWFLDSLTGNVYTTVDLRKNDIDRSTELFNDSNETQLDPVLKNTRSIKAGAELVWKPKSWTELAAGVRAEWVKRDLDFAIPEGGTGDAILPSYTFVNDETEIYTGYLRGSVRPLRGMRLSAEGGVRRAPETGYTRERGDGGYFQLRGFYALPTARPVTLTVFANGDIGENDDFDLSGEAASNSVEYKLERRNFSYGIAATVQPVDSLTGFASFHQFFEEEDLPLVRTNVRRFKAPGSSTLAFFDDSRLRYRGNSWTLTLGGGAELSEDTDMNLSYNLTRVKARLDTNNATATTLRPASEVDSTIHSVETQVGHWLVDGLRLYVGYRFDRYDDDVPARGAGAVEAFGLSTDQHTGTLGVTLTSAFWRK
jgi:hypothetical protein